MVKTLIKYGLAPALLMLGLGVGGADAFVGKPGLPELSAVTPVAMCGYTCSRGGRYIPGPPSVCYDRGMEYCGSSRDRGPGPGVVVPVPGGSVGVGPGGVELRGERCRTVTIERDDGSVRRIRRCD
jgi:hypothetical protein